MDRALTTDFTDAADDTLTTKQRRHEANLSRLQPFRFPSVGLSLFRTASQIYYRVRVKALDGDSAQAIARRLFEAGYAVIVLEEY